MSITITALTARDIRFPTSRELDGSDAMNTDPDYSAAYVVLGTNGPLGRTDVHPRARHRSVRGDDSRASSTCWARRSNRLRRIWERSGTSSRRIAKPDGSAGEGRPPPRHGRHRQRDLISGREPKEACRKLIVDLRLNGSSRSSISTTSPTRSRRTKRCCCLLRADARRARV